MGTARSDATFRSHKRGFRTLDGVRNQLSSDLLATASAPRANDLAATNAWFAREKAVPTGTHEIAWLESPLHFVLEYLVWRGLRAQIYAPVPRPWKLAAVQSAL